MNKDNTIDLQSENKKLQEKFDSLELENMKFEQLKEKEKIRWDREHNKNII